jgi:uncharacterized membrane protein YgcG
MNPNHLFEIERRGHGTTSRIFWAVQEPFLSIFTSTGQGATILPIIPGEPGARLVDTPAAWFYHCAGRHILPMLRIISPSTAFWTSTFVLLSALLAALDADTQKDVKPRIYVNDFAEVLSSSTKDQLTALCAEVDEKAHAQIAVTTVKSLDGRSIDDFLIDLAAQQGIGPNQSERGVLILLVVDDRLYRFEVGSGLEAILTDGKTNGFGHEAMTFLRQANYDAALLLMTRRVADLIAQDRRITLTTPPSAPPPRRLISEQEAKDDKRAVLVLGVIFLLFLFYVGVRRAARANSRQ